MGAQQSKEELVYLHANAGNIEGIRALRRDGAGLEWTDKEGKTPLILACSRRDLLNVAKVLIELGANICAYSPGSHAGTSLHHAAKRGLDQTVNLLLSYGATPFVMNDDCQTPLDLARAKGHCNVVRVIECRTCLICGWLREFYGPSILEAFAPQWVSRKIWAVVLPCASRNPTASCKFELVVYPDLQTAAPRAVIQLWKADIEEPKLNQSDPSLVIVDKASRTRYKFLSMHKGDKQQLLRFYNACRGTSQNTVSPVAPAGATPMPNPPHHTSNDPATSGPTHYPLPEAVQLTMAINSSIQSAISEGFPIPNAQRSALRPSSSSPQLHSSQLEAPTVNPSAHEAPPAVSVPSAPPIVDEALYHGGPIQCPTVGAIEGRSNTSGDCVICLDAPVEGACVPCGHMAGCMSCLNAIKGKNWGCPVCRAKIDQVVRLYAVSG